MKEKDPNTPASSASRPAPGFRGLFSAVLRRERRWALAAACSNMTEALRGQETLPQDPALYAAVQAEYAKVREALDQLDKE